MKNLILLLVFASFLGGCTGTILMKNPNDGAIAQCNGNGANGVLGYYNRDNCVETYEKLGWVKTDTK